MLFRSQARFQNGLAQVKCFHLSESFHFTTNAGKTSYSVPTNKIKVIIVPDNNFN